MTSQRPKVLIAGATGYLGRYLESLYPGAYTARFDISDRRSVELALDSQRPEIVINAAGRTGTPNIDWCETHRIETLRSNTVGPLVLLDECCKREIYLVHLSTGCIYEGSNCGRGFSEKDPPNFVRNFYAMSKAAADSVLLNFPSLILRIRMPFDSSQHPRNLLTKLRGYSKILDAENSMTSLPDFQLAVRTLVERRAIGCYHVVNPGVVSPFHVMELYKEIVDPTHTFERVTADGLDKLVRAPRSNCILSTAKLQSEGIALRSVKNAVRESLTFLRNSLQSTQLVS